MAYESERQTRKRRVDPRLLDRGWKVVTYQPDGPTPDPAAIEEYPTDAGPADYVLSAEGRILAVVEAKKQGAPSGIGR